MATKTEKGGWRVKILDALREGPIRTGDLIGQLGFSGEATMVDVQTRGGGLGCNLRLLSGSFEDSQAQRVLVGIVKGGEVVWRRAANLDNWYGLPGQ